MLDWLAIWGVTQAAGLIFKPILEDLAKDAAKDWAKDLLKGIPGKILKKLKKEDIEIAAGKALKEFLQLMQQQLKVRCKLAEAEIKEYTKDIQKFISDKSVAEILGKAFDINCESLDAKTLEDSWNRLQLKPLTSKFNWQFFAEQYLTQVQELLLDSKELHHILELQKLSDIETNTKEIAGVIVDFNLAKYQEGIRDRYGNLKLDSLDTSGYAYNELKLWKIFTAQNVRKTHQVLPQVHELPKEHLRRLRESDQVEAEVELEELERHKRVYFEQPICSVLDVVNKKQDYKYLVILGDPGSGKSTLLQFLALNWAESPLDNAISLPIPLLIELRTYMRRREDKECNNFLEFFHQCSGAVHHLNQLELDKKLKAGNALVMFDGLDEVFDPGKREDVITDIHRFTNDYPEVQVIVTSRIIGYKPQRLLNAEFRHFILQDLDSEQIQDFINRWHEVLLLIAGMIEPRFVGEIIDYLMAQDGEEEKFVNLFLAAKCLVEVRNRSAIASTANKLLDKLKDLTKYDLWYYYFLYHDKEETKLVQEIHTQTVTTIATTWQESPDTKTFLKECGTQDDSWDVRRAAIQELAKNFKNDPDTKSWLKECGTQDDSWDVRRAAIQELAKTFKNDPDTKIWLKERATQDDNEDVRRAAVEELAKNFKDDSDTKSWLKERAIHDKSYIVQRAAVQELARNFKDDSDTKSFLKERAIQHDNNWDVRRVAIQGLAKNFKNDPDTKIWLKERATQDDNEDVRRAAVEELAKNFKDDSDTKSWLKERAIHDKSYIVQRAAVQELARNFKDDSDTKSFLKECAIQHDNNWDVRRVAIQGLAKNFKDDSDTKTWLKERATQDDNEDVRRAAVEELAKNFKDDSDTKSWLKERAIHDKSYIVQRAAVQELARNFKDDSDTKSFLKECAIQDERYFVRRSAVQELARNFKDDSDLFDIYYQCAVNDPFKDSHDPPHNTNPRRIALEIIIKQFPQHPQTLPLLRDRAQNDPDEQVREFAQKKLAQLEK
ncbi:MAG: HEAT repeat domain-containing protein [Nostoc sp.]|uniref:HEAT repeat domain-containing protein n=1 Tax=Nostoc sp. TaxID=1180 RepID=UPI002FF92568